MANKRRVYKVSEQIRVAIAEELQHTADPRLELVTITSVRASSDLRHAKVYWISDRSRVSDAEDGFKAAAGHFKKVLAKRIGLRFVPDLKFYYDDTLDASEDIERLLSGLNQD